MGSLRDEIEQAAPVLPSHEIDRIVEVIDRRLSNVTPEKQGVAPVRKEGEETTVLHQANKLVRGERQKTYGSPKQNFQQIAGSWSEFLGIHVTPGMVAIMMILLKAQRLSKGYHRDTVVDIAGYAQIAALVEGDDV